MATIVLTAVGTVLGGPIGAAIGAVAGYALDAEIFKPAGRTGPRLSDLRVQTSAYGTQIPKLFGRMRAAGTVIWATDLVEHSERSGGGKGRPSVTTYNYSASFAVALSSRPIRRVERIWADGNLLRGTAGDFKSGIGAFRLHTGVEDQAPDPLIIGDRGAVLTPASRGLAYVVFESLQLADFGNRIPSLTFEIVADEAPVGTSMLLGALADGASVDATGAGSEPQVLGYAASGETVGDAVAPLLDGYGLLARDRVDGLSLIGFGSDVAALPLATDLRLSGTRALAPREEARAPLDSIPRRLALRYYELARDYQAGLQSAERPGAGGAEAQIELPVVLDADAAHEAARQALRRRDAGRRTMTIPRGWDALALGIGDRAVAGVGGSRWRVEALEWESMAVRLSLTALAGEGATPAAGADAGQGVRQADRLVGPSHLLLVETPQLTDAPVDTPQVFATACGEGPGWRGASLLLLNPATSAYDVIGTMPQPAAIGLVDAVVPAASAALLDTASAITVDLYDSGAQLSPASDAALLAGANACLVGAELVQFGEVTRLGPARYRLSRLLRGRRGTEQAIAAHEAGEAFLLLDANSLFPLDDTSKPIGRSITAAALGIGDSTPPTASCTVSGTAILPPSPVHLRFEGSTAAGFRISWVRRSRMGWAWIDGADAPLVEESEHYAVTLRTEAGPVRSILTDTPYWFYDASSIVADLSGSGGAPIVCEVRQIGTHGPSDALIRSLTL